MGIENFYKNESVLVTGASGFIGSHLTKKLLEYGAKTSIFVRKDSNLWRLKDTINEVNIYNLDFAETKKIEGTVKSIEPTIIFHLASFRNVERRIDLLDKLIKTDLIGTIDFLKVFVGKKIRAFVSTGTCEEYGDGPAPFNESQREIPVSPYSATKTAITYYCQMFHKIFNLPVVVLRPFLTYGPMQSFDMFVPSIIEHCLKKKDFSMTSGEQTRDINYIDDIINAYLCAGMKNNIFGEIINIGSGKEYKIIDVAKKILNLMGNPINLKIGDIKKRSGEAEHFYCDNSKSMKLLGWKPAVSLENGLRFTVEWYKEHWKKETMVTSIKK
ncbi:MAG: NAD-dependent epimerase/dehydratase family protein [bacterium]